MLLPPLRSLRYYRERALMSQKRLHELSGVSQTTIHKLEHGERCYPIQGQKLAAVLRVPLDRLVERPPAPHPEPMDWTPVEEPAAVA